MRAVAMEGFTYSYPRSSSPSLDDVYLLVEEGEFLLLAGPSGGGKSTLLRAISGLVPSFHGGSVKGRVTVWGHDTRDMGPADLYGTVGMVFQDPENQLVMTRARNDIAFGLENLGWAPGDIAERVEEVAKLCGAAHLLDRFAPELSGGEKQRLAIAAAMAPRPRILLMDEPTSQLDPRASREVLGLVRDIHIREGITVIMAEHRLDRCLGMADRVAVMEAGEITYDGGPRGLVGGLGAGPGRNGGRGFDMSYVPPLTRVWGSMGGEGNGGGGRPRKAPITRMEALKWLGPGLQGLMRAATSRSRRTGAGGTDSPVGKGREVIRCRGLRFAYDDGPDVLKGVSLTVREGEVLAILGPNGAGKTTLVRMLNGLQRPRSGTVSIMGEDISKRTTAQLARTVGYLAQDPGGYLTRDTLEKELALTLRLQKVPKGRWEGRIRGTLGLVGLEDNAGTDPRSLSCGGRHLSALASVLVGRPRVLVLDEPTRGVDPGHKEKLGRVLRRLARQGMTVVIVTQDSEFASETAGRCAIIDGGRVERIGPAHRILSRRGPYETQVAALVRGAWGSGQGGTVLIPVTVDDVERLLREGGMRNAG